MPAKSRQLNQTISKETYGTDVRDETHVTDEAHEGARTLAVSRLLKNATRKP
jgi:hypothetical protein